MSFIPQARNYKTISGLSMLQRSIYQVEFTIVPQADLYYDLGQSNLRWGSVYTGQLQATAGTSQINTLNVTNSINVQGQNNATSTFQDDLNVQGNLTTNGLTSANGGLGVIGVINTGTMNSSGNVTVGGNHTVNGLTSANGGLGVIGGVSTGTMNSSGNVTVGGNLTVNGSYIGLPATPTSYTTLTVGDLTDTYIGSYSVHPTTNLTTPTSALFSSSINATGSNKGNICKNKVAMGQKFCKKHDGSVIDRPKLSDHLCEYVFVRGNNKGKPCVKKTQEGKIYCAVHFDKELNILKEYKTKEEGKTSRKKKHLERRAAKGKRVNT